MDGEYFGNGTGWRLYCGCSFTRIHPQDAGKNPPEMGVGFLGGHYQFILTTYLGLAGLCGSFPTSPLGGYQVRALLLTLLSGQDKQLQI